MVEQDKIAKNLLLEHTCNNCKHGRGRGSLMCLNNYSWEKVSESQYLNNNFMKFQKMDYPKENTCSKWEGR